MKWYYLDPDYRVKEPDVPHCARCMRRMKAVASPVHFKSIRISDNGLYCALDPLGKHLIGSDCWETITKDPPLKELFYLGPEIPFRAQSSFSLEDMRTAYIGGSVNPNSTFDEWLKDD